MKTVSKVFVRISCREGKSVGVF